VAEDGGGKTALRGLVAWLGGLRCCCCCRYAELAGEGIAFDWARWSGGGMRLPTEMLRAEYDSEPPRAFGWSDGGPMAVCKADGDDGASGLPCRLDDVPVGLAATLPSALGRRESPPAAAAAAAPPALPELSWVAARYLPRSWRMATQILTRSPTLRTPISLSAPWSTSRRTAPRMSLAANRSAWGWVARLGRAAASHRATAVSSQLGRVA